MKTKIEIWNVHQICLIETIKTIAINRSKLHCGFVLHTSSDILIGNTHLIDFFPYSVQRPLRIVHHERMNHAMRSKASAFVHYPHEMHVSYDFLIWCFGNTLEFWHFNDNSHTITSHYKTKTVTITRFQFILLSCYHVCQSKLKIIKPKLKNVLCHRFDVKFKFI